MKIGTQILHLIKKLSKFYCTWFQLINTCFEHLCVTHWPHQNDVVFFAIYIIHSASSMCVVYHVTVDAFAGSTLIILSYKKKKLWSQFCFISLSFYPFNIRWSGVQDSINDRIEMRYCSLYFPFFWSLYFPFALFMSVLQYFILSTIGFP